MRQLRRGAGLCRRRNRRSPALFNRSAMEMGGWTRLLIAGLVAGPVSDARAEGPMPAAASACHFEAAGAGKVSAILDGRSFVARRRARGPPGRGRSAVPPAPGEPGPPLPRLRLMRLVRRPDGGVAATGAGGRSLRPHPCPGLRDRRKGGHAVAHDILAQGYARVGAHVGDPACAAELLAREQAARAAQNLASGLIRIMSSGGPKAGRRFWLKGVVSRSSKARCCRSARAEAPSI